MDLQKNYPKVFFFTAMMICRISDFEKNGHNSLENGQNDLALSIRSVFWVVLGWGLLSSLLLLGIVFFQKIAFLIFYDFKNQNLNFSEVYKKITGRQQDPQHN